MPDQPYRERPSRIAGAVVWTHAVSEVGAPRILPDGCMDLIWADGLLMVAGPDTTAADPGAPASYAGLRFAPGAAPAFLGVPASELRDRRIPLSDIWPAALVRRLTDRVTAAADRCVALEEVALDHGQPADPAIAGVVASLSAGSTVVAAAAAVEMGERRLHRLSLYAFGYGPKTLARILRLNRALVLARGGTPFATVAAQAGYADQAHLSREVRALAGAPLGALV